LSKIRCLIVDDEGLARRVIRDYLKECADVDIVGEAEDGGEALDRIMELSPDLVFLDIQMPVLNGFEVLEQLEDPPAIIFVTAYDEYAIKAFEVNAIDYLKKPCPRERFLAAMERARAGLSSGIAGQEGLRGHLESLLSDIQRDTTYLRRLLIREGSRITMLDPSDILWLQASDDYVTIHTQDGTSHLVTQTLSGLEHKLNPKRFLRVHRSAIINLDQVDSIVSLEDGRYEITLAGGQQVTTSRSGGRTLRKLAL
jgi:two-component system LytT family response regulator